MCNSLVCENCDINFLEEGYESPDEVITYGGGNYCSKDCRNEYNDFGECAYCGQMELKEYSDNSYEDHGCGYTCSDDCHSEAIYLYKRNGGDPNNEHRTY